MTENEIGDNNPRLLPLQCIESWGLDYLNRFTKLFWPMNYSNVVLRVNRQVPIPIRVSRK